MKKLLVGLFLLASTSAWAQNPTCPTRPTSDSSNACASTAFVHNTINAQPLIVGTTPITGSAATNGILFDNAGILGNTPSGTVGAPFIAGSPPAFGKLNLNNGMVATGAPTNTNFVTTDSIGRANPQKYYGATGLSAIFGLPYNGFSLQANLSGDGSFTSGDLVTQQFVTWDKTSDHGTNFLNPQGIPLVDDSTWYNFKATNNALISSNQSVIPGCAETTGFTIAAGQITAIGTVPAGCTGNVYTPSSTIVLNLLASPGFGTGCQITANVNGSGAIASYTGLPCGSGLTAGNATLYFQQPASVCTLNGCVLDVAPQLTIGRQTTTIWPSVGSLLGVIYFAGPTNQANAVGAQAYYASINAVVRDPAIAAPAGELYINTASAATLNAGNTPRVGIGKGLFMTNSTGGQLADQGVGTIHSYQYTIASASNQIAKWTLFSNSTANTLDIYNINAGAIAWTFGTNNGLYSASATGGNKGIDTINAAGVYDLGNRVGSTGTSPIVINATTGVVSCPTCATSSGGGSVTGTAPIAVSAGGVVSINAPYVSLTASNGGIVYSGATNLAILSGTATANLPLLSGSSTAPTWATIAYATSATSGGLAYFSSATQLSSSGALTANAFLTGAGAGAAPNAVSITGLVKGNGASAPTAYAGTSCTNQFPRSLDLNGAATCASVNVSSDVTGQLGLTNGGTNASLVASNGGIFYSSGTAGAILAGTPTGRQMLQSGASTTPAWSTTTWPATATVNRLLYASATNAVTDLATANSSILVTDGSGIPSLSTTLPAHTLGGTISGGGNQINNVIIGTSTPLAGTFTTLTATTSPFTFGAGGTGATLTQQIIDGGSGSGGGPYIEFRKNSVQKWQFGTMSTQGGTSDNFIFFGAGQSVNAMTISSSTSSVTFGNHILATGGTAPTISSCGVSPSISGSDTFGSVTVGTGVVASCVINFGTAYGTAPRCVISSSTAIASATVATSTTQLTVGGTSLTGDLVNWICGSTT